MRVIWDDEPHQKIIPLITKDEREYYRQRIEECRRVRRQLQDEIASEKRAAFRII